MPMSTLANCCVERAEPVGARVDEGVHSCGSHHSVDVWGEHNGGIDSLRSEACLCGRKGGPRRDQRYRSWSLVGEVYFHPTIGDADRLRRFMEGGVFRL